MTTIVGVRELKENAPKLVERAARGERIVIARYGRVQAQLGPVSDPEAAAPSAQHAAWEAERRAFEAMLPRLERSHRGRYVAIRGGRVVAANADPEALYQQVWKKEPKRSFFIGRVGGPPPVVDMPGFDVEP